MNFKEAYPYLMKYWDYEKNTLSPEGVHSGSRTQEVYLKCSEEHSFKKNPVDYKRSLTNKLNCPECKKKITKLFKDEYPYLIKYWDYDKNKNIDLEKLKYRSRKSCYFKCDKGHEVIKKPNQLTKKVSGNLFCRICSGVEVVEETKLENTYPKIAKEYDLNKNKEPLSKISCNSNKDYWWKCKHNHSWKARVRNRTGNFDNKEGHRCPYCWSSGVSRNELILFSEIHQFFKNVVSTKKIKKRNFDIFIEDVNLVIEYDGAYWHQDLKKDKEKNKILEEEKIDIIRIREFPLNKIKKNDIVYNTEEDLFLVLDYILNFLIENYNLNNENEIKEYLINKKITNNELFEKIKDQNKIKQITNNVLFKDYDKEKNSLPLHYYGMGSNYKAFWKCHKCNIEYTKKVKKKNEFPNCLNCQKIKNKLKKKKNISKKPFKHGLTIKETHPKILLELPNDRLEELQELSHTNSRVYFDTICNNCNHVFKTNMWNKVKEKQACPNCNFNILVPEADLLKKYPNLVNEYHKDNKIDLRYATIEYPKLLKWKCEKGHITEKTIENHIKYGDCLECNKGKKIIDIPRIISTWDYEKNNPLGLDPKELTIGSKKIANFKCSVGSDHSWSTKIIKRRKYNCPFCANQKLSITNKLTTTNPEIAKLWSPNNETSPDMYMVGNYKTKFLWNCKYCNEEFSKEIKQMQRTDGMCPCCKTYHLGNKKGKKKGEI